MACLYICVKPYYLSILPEITRFMDLLKMLVVERLPQYLASGMKVCITWKARSMGTESAIALRVTSLCCGKVKNLLLISLVTI